MATVSFPDRGIRSEEEQVLYLQSDYSANELLGLAVRAYMFFEYLPPGDKKVQVAKELDTVVQALDPQTKMIFEHITGGETRFTLMCKASTTVKAAIQFLHEVTGILLEKNAKYGDSAANPMRVFSRTDCAEQIKVRIDDKLSRIKTMSDKSSDEDTVADLVGYLALLRAVSG